MEKNGTRFKLENEELSIEVDCHGAQLSSIYDKKAGREILWDAAPEIWNRHSPLLFPFVGKSCDGVYRHKGKTYDITPHGFARDMDFEPLLCDMDECWYRLLSAPETLEHYPFSFELEVGHSLSGRTVTTMWRVRNTGFEEMFFMIGGHPAFRVPEGKTIYDYSFSFNQEGCNQGKFQQGLHYLAPNDKGLEEEELGGFLELSDGRVSLTKGFFDRALTYMVDGAQVSSVSLLTEGKPYVTVLCDNFPYLGIWTIEKTHLFVCLEPWYGLCDTLGFTGELKERKGINRLQPGETWQRQYSIRID